jgi:hydrogenase maturation protein HypF
VTEAAAIIRVRGLVQGVGFRPTVWHLAHVHGLRGSVINDGSGVRIHVCGPLASLERFILDLPGKSPPLARIDHIERGPAPTVPADAGFHIAPSEHVAASEHLGVDTGVAPDAATCAACMQEIFDPSARRYRYPFTNCTHCGPRLSIIRAVPYDRTATTMAGFTLCARCSVEYHDPADRRFHAEPIACSACGPRIKLVHADDQMVSLESLTALDEVDAAASLLLQGHILAIQGIGGYQLACDATQPPVVARLRALKHRDTKPFALMARDMSVIRHHAVVSADEAALLSSTAAPIVLLRRIRVPVPHAPDARVTPPRATVPLPPSLADEVAPRLNTLGFMLPNTPLHHLLLARLDRPIVLTSGNSSDEPQAIDAADARQRLGSIADHFLEHDRPIERRVDDSVSQIVAGRARVLRRARGYAPGTLPLPPGFEASPPIFSYGGELKNTFCLLHDGSAVLSAHMGDLQDALTRTDQRQAMADLCNFLDFRPRALACDRHPGYSASRAARARAASERLPLFESQHHHAHIAACLAENRIARDAAPVLGVALDGMGYGDDGTLWGGEFLLADYVGYRRLGTFKSVALIGGDAAIREPWRNTYAHLMADMGWPQFAGHYADLELYRFLEAKPRALLDGMLARRVNSPLASSCGRLFDAVAAAMSLAQARASYEGQGAMEMEAAVDHDCLSSDDASYEFQIHDSPGLALLEPSLMWRSLLHDLSAHTPIGVMAARFHSGLATGIVQMVVHLAARLATAPGPSPAVAPSPAAARPRVALSGGVFQNRIIFERVLTGLQSRGFDVLTHSQVPCNDGGLALGQSLIAAARILAGTARD